MAKFFIGRPIVAIVIAIITVLAGLVVMRGLPEAQFPDIVPPQIIVSTTYPGADAQTVEQSVATPIEQQMNGVDNMLYMQSTNGNDNTMQLTVTFDVDTDVNTDEVNVQNRVAQAAPNLPPDVNQFGTTIRKSTGLPLLAFALYSPNHTHDSLFLANYANININDQLLRVPGAGQVLLFGATDYSMRIWIKPQVLAKLGLTVTDLVNALNQQNTVNPAGQVGGNPAPAGNGDDLYRPHAGTTGHRGSIWPDCRARESRWLRRPAAGRCSHRAWLSQLQRSLSIQRTAELHCCRLS